MFVEIILDINSRALDRPYTYRVPENLRPMAKVGAIAQVPFGKSNKIHNAYIIEVKDHIEKSDFKIKDLIEIKETGGLAFKQIRMAHFIKNYYEVPFSQALKLMVPPDIKRPKKYEKTYKVGPKNLIEEYIKKLSKTRFKKRLEICKHLYGDLFGEHLEKKDLIEELGATDSIIKTLVRDKILIEYEKELSPIDYYISGQVKEELRPVLNQEQKQIVDNIMADFTGTHLIHGVTGSGKTEIYFELIERVMQEGKQAIILVPEIGLTPAMVRRFWKRFGNVLGLIHSRLSEGEKFIEWQRAKKGEIKVMLGPRSALFAPFDNLGIIIIDEEHETTYKSDSSPNYHAKEIAIMKGHYEKFPVILASATPSIDSYRKAIMGKYKLHSLTSKALTGNKIDCKIVDMRQELRAGNRSFMSLALRQAINQALAKNEQVLLLINRRGYSFFISCRECGFVYKCKYCDNSMTYHRTIEALLCHQCGYSSKLSKKCPQCGSSYIKSFGMGTQKLEKELRESYPSTNIVRMDYDTTRGKHGHAKVLEDFEMQDSGILLGTQMVAKGHDLHRVTVVGVLSIDQSLYIQDYRAAERTFQLLTQVIGRTGRGEKKGRAIIQTYTPDHYAVKLGVEQDYPKFFKEEIRYRKAMNNPPFVELLQIIVADDSPQGAHKTAHMLATRINKLIKTNKLNISAYPPIKPVISKISGRYREKILLKGDRHRELVFIMKEIYRDENIKKIKSKIKITLNPSYLE